MVSETKHVLIYTDGACDPNPRGRGGYGIVLSYNGKKREISGGFCSTTNNRMEVYAAIKALESLKEPCRVTLYSDSEYLVKAINEGWAKRWKDNNWLRNKQERAINVDLWEKLLALCDIHQVEFVWVEGHSGHPENERCDYLSVNALKQDNLPPDEGYKNRYEDEDKKVKITQEGQPCRKCSTPVVKRIPKKPKKTQAYYFEYYFYCPKCGTMYMVEEAKRMIDETLAAQLEITQERQHCLKCSTPVVKRMSRKSYYYLYCPKCHTSYEIKKDKQDFEERPPLF
jgi:ribonuclease HI